eukprot:12441832-Ditylum_brightwellii.AAC.1
MDPQKEKPGAFRPVEGIHSMNNAVSSNDLTRNVPNDWAKASQMENEIDPCCQTQMSDPPEQGNEVQTDGNEQRCVSADSSPPSEDDETEEQMQASYDSDMNMIKNLKNMLQKLKEINDNLKFNKAEMTDEVTDLRVEREILIAEGKGPSRC